MKKLGKYENPKVKKTWKLVTILSCILLFVPCLALATFGILHLANVTDLKDESTHIYNVRFYDEETSEVYHYEQIIRGGKFKYTYKPSKSGFKFRGWDINNDSFPDMIPTHIFKDINARALWVIEKDLPFGGNK